MSEHKQNGKFWEFIRKNSRVIIWGLTGFFTLTVTMITLKSNVGLNAASIMELKTECKDTVIFKAEQRELNRIMEKSLDVIHSDVKRILEKMWCVSRVLVTIWYRWILFRRRWDYGIRRNSQIENKRVSNYGV